MEALMQEVEGNDDTGTRSDKSWGFEEGDELAPGRYVMKLLGGGRRYEAYLVHDEQLLSLTVVKILRPSRVSDRGALDGLMSEYRTLQSLNHPVIARGFDAVLAGERPHLVLEFLDGPRLSTLIRRHGPLPLEQLIPLAVQLSSAVHYMHRRSFVHLDVKPSNIIMGAPPRLIDMSIARTFEEASVLDVPVGTDAYMAPEQCDPRPGNVGPGADVWGIGVTLYEALTGSLPFPTKGDGAGYPQLESSPEPFDARLPRPVTSLIESCLEFRSSDRPSASELANSLEPLVAILPRKPVLSRFRPRM